MNCELQTLIDNSRFRPMGGGFGLNFYFHEISAISGLLNIKGSTYSRVLLTIIDSRLIINVDGTDVKEPQNRSFAFMSEGKINRWPLDLLAGADVGWSRSDIDMVTILSSGLPDAKTQAERDGVPCSVKFLDAVTIAFYSDDEFPLGFCTVRHNGNNINIIQSHSETTRYPARNMITMPESCTEDQFRLYTKLIGVFKKMQSDLATASKLKS